MENPGLLTALLVEDDVRLGQLTAQYLERHDVVVTRLGDGKEGLEEALRTPYDVVLLDIMLPGLDGIEVCRRLRAQSDVPVIMLTARDEEADRVMGLEIGADDYMPKPFSPRELLARIRAHVRRARGKAGPRLVRLERDGLVLDPGARTAVLDAARLDLTAYEFDLLYALAERPGRVLGREQLMALARGVADEAFERSVDVHISRLRAKLGDRARPPRFIRTVRGVGYQFVAGEGDT